MCKSILLTHRMEKMKIENKILENQQKSEIGAREPSVQGCVYFLTGSEYVDWINCTNL